MEQKGEDNMPMKFPDTWGTKKQWPPVYLEKPPIKTKQKKEERLSAEGKMKCPQCGEWVDEFNVNQETTEFGTVDSHGSMDFHDSDCNSFEIVCPRCNRTVFDSDITELEEYYHPRHPGQ